MGGPVPASRSWSFTLSLVLKKPSWTSRPAASAGGVSKNGSTRRILANTGHLRHQFQDIPFRIAESHHPKIVAWHWRNQPRWRFDFRAQLEKLAVRGVDIGNPEVQDGARVIQLGRFRRAEHQPNTAAIKERQVGDGEQQWQTQRVTVECLGPLEIANNDIVLADIYNAQVVRTDTL